MDDRARWNERYCAGEGPTRINPRLQQYLHLLKRGRAFDLAGGIGQNEPLLADWDVWRAIREGVDPDGRTLLMMNAIGDPRFLSGDDLQALIAYLRSQPAVRNEPPQESPSLVALLLVGGGLVPGAPPVTGTVTAPPRGATTSYGEYVVHYIGCRGCHGEDLAGNPGLGPHGPNLTLVVPKWSQDKFVQYVRSGVNPDMEQYTRMDDVELAAMYQYLHSLTPIQK